MYQVYRWYREYGMYSSDMDETRMGTREMREHLGYRVDAAHFKGEPTIVTRNGEPRAVLISYAEWAALREDAGEPPS